MNLKDYACDGQMNIWEYIYQVESKPKPKQEPDDSICEGCKWRKYPARELEIDEHGQTWVYKCPGTACANWKYGTPLNLSVEKPSKEVVKWYEPEKVIHCFNHDYLPTLEQAVEEISKKYGLEFTSYEADWNKPDNPTVYKHVFKKHSYLEISEGVFAGTDTRYIAVDWEGYHEGTSCPCESLVRIIRAVDNAIYRNEHIKKPKKKGDDDDAEG